MDTRRAEISGVWALTAEDVVLVVLVGLGAHLDETLETIVVDELVH